MQQQRDYTADPAVAYQHAYGKALRPREYLTIPLWAEKFRVLSQRDSEEYGPWRNWRTPYLVGIMEALSPRHPCREVVFMKGAQIGATQCGNNFIGYYMDREPCPMLLVQPTVELAKRNSRQRIDPMIESCPTLREKISTGGTRTRDAANTQLIKEFPNGLLIMTGANSAAALRSASVKILFLDEEDAYPPDVDQEGDPASLAITRARNYRRAKIFRCSTPTVFGVSRVESAYEAGDQRRFYVPCPHCDNGITLEWGGPDSPFGVKFDREHPRDAFYLCPECACEIKSRSLHSMLRGGEWRATAQSTDPSIVSFHLSALYSPWYSWGDAAVDWRKSKDDPLKLKWFVNTVLGETWKDKYTSLQGDIVKHRNAMVYPSVRIGDVDEPLVPAHVAVMTAGVDVQDDRLEMTVDGWGSGKECWKLEHYVFRGDPAEPEVWGKLWSEILRPRRLERGGEDVIRATSIDTGGHHTQITYDFCRPRTKYKTNNGRNAYVFAIKGTAGSGRIWPLEHSEAVKLKSRVNLWNIKVDPAKELLYARLLQVDEPGPGYIHFPAHFKQEYYDQLSAERAVTKNDTKGFPFRTWELKTPGLRNETLDCSVYSLVALTGLESRGFDLELEASRLPDFVSDRGGTALSVGEGVDPQEPVAASSQVGEGRPRTRRRRSRSKFLG